MKGVFPKLIPQLKGPYGVIKVLCNERYVIADIDEFQVYSLYLYFMQHFIDLYLLYLNRMNIFVDLFIEYKFEFNCEGDEIVRKGRIIRNFANYKYIVCMRTGTLVGIFRIM